MNVINSLHKFLSQFTFIPLHRRHAMGSVLYPGCFLAGLALYYWHFFTRGEDNDGELLPEVFVRVHVAYYVVSVHWLCARAGLRR